MAFSKDLCQALKPVKPKIRSTAMFIVIRHDTRRWIWIINIARLHVAIIWITHNKEIITIYSIFHDWNVDLVFIYFSTNYLFVLSTFFHHLSFLFSSSSIIITFITYIITYIHSVRVIIIYNTCLKNFGFRSTEYLFVVARIYDMQIYI